MAPLSFRRSEKPLTPPAEPSSTSTAPDTRSFSSRLLRRKPSSRAPPSAPSQPPPLIDAINIETDTSSTPGPLTASTSSTFADQLEAGHPFSQASKGLRRTSESDDDGSSSGPAQVYAGASRYVMGQGPTFERRLSEPVSPAAARRAAWVYKDSRTQPFQLNDPSTNGGVVIIDADIPPLPTDHPLIPAHLKPTRPVSPSRFEPKPIYPTALSPPRRPMPRSPSALAAAAAKQAQEAGQSPLRNSGRGNSDGNAFTQEGINRSLSPAVSLDDRPITLAPSPGNGASSIITPEWLARRPSARRRPHTPPPTKLEPSPTLLRRSRNQSSSGSTSADESLADADDSDGEIDRRPAQNGGYQVSVACVDGRQDDDSEVVWTVRVRRGPPDASTPVTPHHPSSPLHLSTATATVQAPPSATSLNLSLSLDEPTGKLVFIAFPMDIHATPTRRRPSMSKSSPRASSGTSASNSTPPPRISTPPPHTPRRRPTTPSPSPGRAEVYTPRRTRLVSAAMLDGGLYGKGSVDGMSEDLEIALELHE
ncbi:hypothetical protein BCR39DRAFT_547638 [Naematelia encephala]|uniref:Uncharacterized protein n=1 Tax=Naematelia encephala TaxID=71784 RepID=A0A1Y2API0_9TREE|nr:hypothetical protein BCR39DRAFT_547638 [Naematelia encephala]